MYVPESFRIATTAECQAMMRAHSFATLITAVAGQPPEITHLPVMVDASASELGVIRGHLARANGHWRAFAEGNPSVVIFQGPHHYISPRWYAAPVAVPTWNYVAVHAHGCAEIVTDRDAVRQHLTELAERYETGPNPWRVAELPDDVYEKLTAGIVYFRLPIERLEGKAKLGQNRSAEDRAGLLAGLEALAIEGAQDLAAVTRTAAIERGAS